MRDVAACALRKRERTITTRDANELFNVSFIFFGRATLPLIPQDVTVQGSGGV